VAIHILENEHGRSIIVQAIRYDDAFARQDGGRRFARRNLVID
jgi:hypothetical protein